MREIPPGWRETTPGSGNFVKITLPDRPIFEPAPIPEPLKFEQKQSTDEEKLNKTERAWLTNLRVVERNQWIGIQNITLKLGFDTRYTPDFMVILPAGNLVAYEVKGFMRDDAAVKIKVAARLFPWIEFILVKRNKKEWILTQIRP